MNKVAFFIFICFLILLFSCKEKKQLSQKELIIGTWQFSSFEVPSYADRRTRMIIKKENLKNKDLELLFEPDGRFEFTGDSSNIGWQYKFLPDSGKLLIMYDTTRIVHIDERWLKIYKNDSTPVAVFMRKQ